MPVRITDAELHAGLVIVGGECGLGAPRMATSRRLALAPATAELARLWSYL
jgi:hypothetical protein